MLRAKVIASTARLVPYLMLIHKHGEMVLYSARFPAERISHLLDGEVAGIVSLLE
jgi:hypothetical protein